MRTGPVRVGVRARAAAPDGGRFGERLASPLQAALHTPLQAGGRPVPGRLDPRVEIEARVRADAAPGPLGLAAALRCGQGEREGQERGRQDDDQARQRPGCGDGGTRRTEQGSRMRVTKRSGTEID